MPCFLQHPEVPVRHIGAEDGGGEFGVVGRHQDVADVVQQGTDHILLILTGLVGARGGLQAVLQPVHGEKPPWSPFSRLRWLHNPVDMFAARAPGRRGLIGGPILGRASRSWRMKFRLLSASLRQPFLVSLSFCPMVRLSRARVNVG